MRRRKSPQRSRGAQTPPERVRVRRAGSNLRGAEMESSQLPENSCTPSPVAQAGPARCRSSAAYNVGSNIINYLRNSQTVVSLNKRFRTSISTLQEMAKKESGLYVLLFLVFLCALTGAYCGFSLARVSLTKDFLQEVQDLKEAVPVRPRGNCFTKSDWALKSAGISIDLHRSSRSAWRCRVAWFLCAPNVLETFKQLDISPGYCWPVKTSQSQMVFNLPTEVQPTAVTVQHTVDTTLWHISSAPRDFAVFGLDEKGENKVLLGKFTYDIREELSQTFELQTETPRAFWHIKLSVLNNWGNAGHTCIYRVQVHGKSAGIK
ncbi:SUN domain-containing protein 3-like [Meleagris gallopavo]|uniref:SUN domain-containing protein n=1 Tax=Meleagris gallopavo TaxID=9103 RepID=A0A803YA91_MELGA|nr:SUN domain-containing protein 3-like [Meleagris gallopavo]